VSFPLLFYVLKLISSSFNQPLLPYIINIQAYWPFHKSECRRNEFADLIEESEPKFARWMRSHGKVAVLKDDEVDRLERASSAASGPSRQDVMDSMYGRLEPKPKGKKRIFLSNTHCLKREKK
jgi:hypothetical protein